MDGIVPRIIEQHKQKWAERCSCGWQPDGWATTWLGHVLDVAVEETRKESCGCM